MVVSAALKRGFANEEILRDNTEERRKLEIRRLHERYVLGLIVSLYFLSQTVCLLLAFRYNSPSRFFTRMQTALQSLKAAL